MPDRLAARVVLIDRDDSVLLFSGRDSTDPSARQFWFTPGGGAEDGESIGDAARREVSEETGFELGDIGPCIWQRHAAFDFEGETYRQDEQYFVVRVERFEVRPTFATDLETRSMTGSKWCIFNRRHVSIEIA